MSNRSINYCDPKRVIRSLGYARSGVHKSTLVNNSATARFVFMGAPGSVAQFKWSNFIDCDLKSYLYYTRGLTALWPYYRNNQLLQVCNATPTNVISQYDYGYDVAGRRISCAKSGSAFTQDDTVAYGYNSRSELTNAAAAVDSAYRYSYAFDDIGNREAATERGTNSFYAANKLNQYTSISNFVSSVSFVANEFSPQFDDDGNQALIKTATGVWQVLYNGENRPILWTQGTNTITMSYDRQGRRVTKNDQRFVYDGYQQIADNSQLLQVCNAFPTNVISQYDYTYDAAGRRVACGKSGSAFAQDDTLSYGYNEKSELTNAVAAIDAEYRYAYDFDDIGNRLTSSERGTNSFYAANQLNQYTEISDSALFASPRETFTPQFDDDGNQTLIKTSTGIWSVTYNGENRPVLWENVSTNSPTPNSTTPTLISMSYDRIGRRVTKNNQRFVYDGYLQIANIEHQTSNIKLQTFIWDPTEPVATRPLVWNSSTLQPFNFSTSYYVHNGNKNVSEVVAENGDIAAHYDYAPFGAVIARRGASAAANPWRFSSEFAEDDTGTVYYNYRVFESRHGLWMSRDLLEDGGHANLYVAMRNNPISRIDLTGLKDAMSTRGGRYSCSQTSAQTASAHKSFSIVGAELHFDMDLSIEGKNCKKCCQKGTARAGEEVIDTEWSVYLTAKISGSKGTFSQKFDSSFFGGWWAAPNVRGEMYAGVKVEGFGAVSASGNVGSDRCDNHELSGSVCIQGQVGLSVSGGAVFDVYWNDAHFKAGGEITGMVTASLSRCYTCNSKGCSLGATQLCIEGDVSLHIYLWYWHMNHTLWNRGKCFEL